jgi:bifunctional non-homologous end joining protein LigD
MLAKPGALPESGDGRWGYEIKWDGVRALGFAERGKWRMCSRRGEEITSRYPELAPLAEQIANRTAILDGEVVALDEQGRPRFQLLQARMGLTSEAMVRQRAAARPVDFVIFDLLHLDDHSTRELPYLERRELLESLDLNGARWRTPGRRSEGGAELLEAARRQGLEGIVAKRYDSPYRPGKRTGEWIKARVWRRQEFVIGGWIPGEGRRADRIGSLLVGYWDRRESEATKNDPQRLVFAGGVGSGLKESDLDFLTRELRRRELDQSPFEVGVPKGPKAKLARFCRPDLVCEVSWTEWTNEGTLRQPAFKGMRDDKDARDVVRES